MTEGSCLNIMVLDVLKGLFWTYFWPGISLVMRHPEFQLTAIIAKSSSAWNINSNSTMLPFDHIAIKWN